MTIHTVQGVYGLDLLKQWDNAYDDILLGLGAMWTQSEDEDSMLLQMFSSTNQSTWRLNPKEHHHNQHRCENLKFLTGMMGSNLTQSVHV